MKARPALYLRLQLIKAYTVNTNFPGFKPPGFLLNGNCSHPIRNDLVAPVKRNTPTPRGTIPQNGESFLSFLIIYVHWLRVHAVPEGNGIAFRKIKIICHSFPHIHCGLCHISKWCRRLHPES
jgi:hypothetical protein